MKKIVITGPESVGKTTLCLELLTKLNAVYIPEFARTYVEQIGRNYTYEDVEIIARQQVVDLQKTVAEESDKDFVIMDTFLIVTKVWFLHVYKRCPDWLQSELEKAEIDLFILLKPDIEWKFDAARENPHIRQYLYDWYKKELENIEANFVEIGGIGKTRTEQALQAIEQLK